MRADRDSDWPHRLLKAIQRFPLIDEPHSEDFRLWQAHISTELTNRELDFLAAASHGLTAPMTADLYDVTPDTVQQTLRSARFKLRAKNTAHAAAKAIRAGLIA